MLVMAKPLHHSSPVTKVSAALPVDPDAMNSMGDLQSQLVANTVLLRPSACQIDSDSCQSCRQYR